MSGLPFIKKRRTDTTGCKPVGLWATELTTVIPVNAGIIIKGKWWKLTQMEFAKATKDPRLGHS